MSHVRKKIVMKPFVRLQLVVVSACLLVATATAQDPKVSVGSSIMISAHPLAAKAGLEVYKKGGNVVDVAVATAYALGVVEPHGSGIGGEGMMLIYNAKTKTPVIVDFKAISPSGATMQTLDLNAKSTWARTAKGASVPGSVAGLEYAREHFGKLDRTTVLRPAIRYAMEGYQVDSTLALNVESYRRILEKDPYASSLYYPKGQAVKSGAIVKNPDYGKTLMAIEAKGADGFYKGEVADLIVRYAKQRGGFMTYSDLLAYKPVVREAVRGSYRGFEIITTPPPCGGMLLIEALNILKHFDLRQCRSDNEYSLHLFAEVFKLVFRDEATWNGDPDFTAIPVKHITSEEFAFQRFLRIDLAHARHPQQVEAGRIDDKNTTQLCVMDAWGNTVSLTTRTFGNLPESAWPNPSKSGDAG